MTFRSQQGRRAEANKAAVPKPKRSLEIVPLSDQALVRMLVAEHAALAQEMLHLVRELRAHMSLVSTLVDAKVANTALKAGNVHVYDPRRESC